MAYPDILKSPLGENLLIKPFISALTGPEQCKFGANTLLDTLKAAADVAELYEVTKDIEQKRVDCAVPPAVGNNDKKPVRALSTSDVWKSLKAEIFQEVRVIVTVAQYPPRNRGRPRQSQTHKVNSYNQYRPVQSVQNNNRRNLNLFPVAIVTIVVNMDIIVMTAPVIATQWF